MKRIANCVVCSLCLSWVLDLFVYVVAIHPSSMALWLFFILPWDSIIILRYFMCYRALYTLLMFSCYSVASCFLSLWITYQHMWLVCTGDWLCCVSGARRCSGCTCVFQWSIPSVWGVEIPAASKVGEAPLRGDELFSTLLRDSCVGRFLSKQNVTCFHMARCGTWCLAAAFPSRTASGLSEQGTLRAVWRQCGILPPHPKSHEELCTCVGCFGWSGQ